MSQHFIPVSFETIQPLTTPMSLAERIAAHAGAPSIIKRVVGENIHLFNNNATAKGAEHSTIRLQAAEIVAAALLKGMLPSFVQAIANGKFYQIPLGYWMAHSGTDRPWSEIDTFWGCSFAVGNDESMVGQTVFVSEQAADFLMQYVGARIGQRTEQVKAFSPTDRTGAPGPPSSMHLVREMMRKRFEAGDALPTMAQEAAELERLFATNADYAQLARPRAKTIRNVLGFDFRQLKAKAEQK